MTTVRERMIELINKKGLSRKEFADRVGISQNQISRYLTKNDPQIPTVNTLMKICDEFNVSMDWICGRDNNESRFRITDDSDVLSALKEIEIYCGMSMDFIRTNRPFATYAISFDGCEGLTEFVDSIGSTHVQAPGDDENGITGRIINTLYETGITTLKGSHEAQSEYNKLRDFLNHHK